MGYKNKTMSYNIAEINYNSGVYNHRKHMTIQKVEVAALQKAEQKQNRVKQPDIVLFGYGLWVKLCKQHLDRFNWYDTVHLSAVKIRQQVALGKEGFLF